MDNKTQAGRPGRAGLNGNEKYTAEYWSKVFGVSTSALKKALEHNARMQGQLSKLQPA